MGTLHFLGVSLAPSPFAVFPEDDVTAFVIDETALPACTRIRRGGVRVVEAPIADMSLADGLFWPSLRQVYVRLVRRAGRGGGQGSLCFSQFPSRLPWFGGVFFVMGGRICVESTVSMVQQSGDKTHKSFAKRQKKCRVMTT